MQLGYKTMYYIYLTVYVFDFWFANSETEVNSGFPLCFQVKLKLHKGKPSQVFIWALYTKCNQNAFNSFATKKVCTCRQMVTHTNHNMTCLLYNSF